MGKSAELKKNDEDRQFLKRLRECQDVYDLERMLTNHRHKKSPEWKKVAIIRRLEKLKTTPPVPPT
jgi:hypothetical protein